MAKSKKTIIEDKVPSKELLTKKYQQAQKLQQNGYLDDAKKVYDELLQVLPDSPDCIHFLGLIYFQQGKLELASEYFQKSISLSKNPLYFCNYSLLANHIKDYDKAIHLLEEAIDLRPNYSEAWLNLGSVHSARGNMVLAEKAYLNAVKFNSNYIRALFNLAVTQEALGKKKESVETIDRIIKLKPSENLYHTLGLALYVLDPNRYSVKAIKYFKKAIKFNPDSLETYRALATLYVESNSNEKALEVYKKISDKIKSHRDLNLEFASCLVSNGDLTKADIIYNSILDIEKENTIALNGKASIQQLLGNFIESESIYKKVLKNDPYNQKAYYGYSQCKKVDESDREYIHKLEGVIKNKENLFGFYALGKMYNDLGEYDKAFSNYKKANDIRSKKINFESELYSRKIDSIINVFTKKFINHFTEIGNLSEAPIFIIGSPRSGTTLIEQIISSHSSVHGAGELNYIRRIAYERTIKSNTESYPERLLSLINSDNKAEEIIRRDSEIYLKEINSYLAQENILRVTDKMPNNFLYIGYIFMLFPNAKIIHAKRNPIDTCLSIYFQNFNSEHKYSFQLDDILFWYKEYSRLMAHWNGLYGDKILDIHYDKIINDIENTAKQMISHCNLNWEDQCVEFYKTGRAIHTSSSWQAKQPIYQTSRDRWRKYEKFIPELIDGLSELT
ncbi:MAG: sulfotransferase [Gammaproteobacteria bacterium]